MTEDSKNFNIDEETIRNLGLQPSDKSLSDSMAPNTRIYNYPHLENVFIMERDLYGNELPEGSCYLAFYGRNGLMGHQIKIEKLKNANIEEIKEIVEGNSQG